MLSSRRAAQWLVLVAMGSGAGGCFLPQEETFLTQIPRQQNRPPRIVESQVQPSERIIRDFGINGLCELEFSVAVEDPDVNDLITVHWYIDYDPSNPSGSFRDLPLQNTGQPQRGDRANLRIKYATTTSSLRTAGLHLVEAVVADTRLVDREPQPVYSIELPDGGPLNNPGYATSYAWFVQTAQGGTCQ